MPATIVGADQLGADLFEQARRGAGRIASICWERTMAAGFEA